MILTQTLRGVTRREALLFGRRRVATLALPRPSFSQTLIPKETLTMGYVTTTDGTEIFYKDWGPRTRSRSSSTTAGR